MLRRSYDVVPFQKSVPHKVLLFIKLFEEVNLSGQAKKGFLLPKKMTLCPRSKSPPFKTFLTAKEKKLDGTFSSCPRIKRVTAANAWRKNTE